MKLNHINRFIASQPKLICFIDNSNFNSNINALNRNDSTTTSNSTISVVTDKSKACAIYSHHLNSTLTRTTTQYRCELDTSFFKGFAAEWEFICDKEYLASLTQSWFLIGKLLSIGVGFICDKFGRKLTILSLTCSMSVLIALSALIHLPALALTTTTKYVLYSMHQLALGGLCSGLFSAGFLLALEITTPDHSTLVTNIAFSIYVLGQLVVVGLASLVTNDWHSLQLIIVACSLACLFLIVSWLPESPRYLLEKGGSKKRGQAIALLETFGKVNGRKACGPKLEALFAEKDREGGGEKSDLILHSHSHNGRIMSASQYQYQASQDNQMLKKQPEDVDNSLESSPTLLGVKSSLADLFTSTSVRIREVKNSLLTLEEETIRQVDEHRRRQKVALATGGAANDENEVPTSKQSGSGGLFAIFSPASNFLKTLVFVCVWFILSLNFYGASLGIMFAQGLGPHSLLILGAVAEFLGLMLSNLNDLFGRRRMLLAFIVSASACQFVSLLVDVVLVEPTPLMTVGLMLLSKVMLSAAFTSIYVVQSLLYPTSTRSMALLFCGNVGGMGSMLAPQMNVLGPMLWAPLPNIVYSALGILGAILFSLLPDPDKVNFM